jgi:hypothetical protein
VAGFAEWAFSKQNQCFALPFRNQSGDFAFLSWSEGMRSTFWRNEMNKLALMAASVAVLGLATPSFASDSVAQGRIQLAQAAGVSVSVGDGPRVRSRVVVRERHHDRGYHRGWRHSARADRVVIVKKHRPARKTVIIER